MTAPIIHIDPPMSRVIENMTTSFWTSIFGHVVRFPGSPDPFRKVLPTLPLIESGVDDVGGGCPGRIKDVLVSTQIWWEKLN